MGDYRELIVWQRSMELLVASHAIARALPPHAHDGMASQIRRASESIPANIVEGHARATRSQFRYFVNVAYASARELHNHLTCAVAVEYVTAEATAPALALADEVAAMLYGLQRSLGD